MKSKPTDEPQPDHAAPDLGPAPEPPPVSEPEPPDPETRRARLLEGVDPDIARLISDDELDIIEADERQKAADERKKQALASVRATLKQRARVENDLISADVLRSDAERKRLLEPVTFTVRLPNDGAGHHGRNGIRVDGFLYQQGHTYTRPRGVFETLRDIHFRSHLNEVQFRTLDQHKPGQSAREIIGDLIPRFEAA